MKTKNALLFIVFVSVQLAACVSNTVMEPSYDSTMGSGSPDSIRAKEHALLEKALAIRARELKDILGYGFSDAWTPIAASKHISALGIPLDALYTAEDQTITFGLRFIYKLKIAYETPFRFVSPEVLAHNNFFGQTADHELGHALTDEVSRNIGNGPYSTNERFETLSDEERLGLKIIREGTGVFFEHVRYPMREPASEMCFPAGPSEEHNYDAMAYRGGYWIVHDILSQYGLRGLEWLVSHSFVADAKNIREAAINYRARALAELAK